MTEILIDAVLTGKIQAFSARGASAIHKAAVSGPVEVDVTGLRGDEQADRLNHGGPDMAVHYYPHDHYGFWNQSIGPHDLLSAPGAFGENLSATGLLETEACIGDRYRAGTALLEISQGRQPCWKLAHKFGVKSLPANIVETGYCGWYFRVLEPGTISAGDGLRLLDRPNLDWTVARVFSLLIAGGAKADADTVRALSKLESLSDNWRGRAAQLAAA